MAASAPWLARGALIGAAVCAAGTALLLLRLRGRVGAGLLVLGLAGLTVADTWRIDRLFLRYEDPARHTDYRQANPDARRFLEQQPGRFRLFPVPGYGFLKNAPLPPRRRRRGHRFGRLRPAPLRPPAEGGCSSPRRCCASATPRAVTCRTRTPSSSGAARPLLDLVGARFLVTPRSVELRAEGFPEVFAGANLRLYANETARPWFYLAPHAEVLPGEQEVLTALREGRFDLRRTVLLEEPPPIELPRPGADLGQDRVTEEEPRGYREGVVRLRLSAGGPRLLVVGDNFHPHWRALVDGRPAPLLRADYVWKAVPVPAGEHLVELLYRSPPVARARAPSAPPAPSWSWPGRAWPCGGGAGQRLPGRSLDGSPAGPYLHPFPAWRVPDRPGSLLRGLGNGVPKSRSKGALTEGRKCLTYPGGRVILKRIIGLPHCL